MRGNYHTSHEERKRFFQGLSSACGREEYDISLTNTNLCLRDCIELVQELGYEPADWDYDCEEIWITCYQENCPNLTVMSDGYIGSLKLFYQPSKDPQAAEKIIELMRKHWGKYFPVI